MRSALIRSSSQPPSVVERPAPERGPGEALVRMLAASLNPVERHIWSGHFFDGPPALPYVPGLEGVGVVEEGDALAPGTRVRVEVIHPGYGRDGVLSELAVLPETPDERDRAAQAMTFPVADGVDDVTAAALGTSGFTALMVLERAAGAGARLEGAHVLVLAGTGVVGSCLIQLAREHGAARVVVAGRNRARLERAHELGADATVELEEGLGAGELSERFSDAAAGRLDLVVEPLWGEPARAAIEALSPNGVLVNYGHVSSSTAELASLPLRNRRVTLVGHSGAWTTAAQRRAAYEQVHALAAAGRLVVDTDELTLDELPGAWERLGASAGAKLVVRLGG